MRRWYLGLHGLALLRGWPFGDPAEATARLATMRALLEAPDDELEERTIDALGLDDAYRDWAATYDEPNALIVAEERAIGDVLDPLPVGRALDVATGTGRLARRLVDLKHDVVAVDRSESMLERARASVPEARLVQTDLTRLPFADGSFDLVTCALALTHVSDLRGAIGDIARVVAPGGAVAVSDISPVAVSTGGHAFFRREDDSRGVARNQAHWPGTYLDAARAAGLTVERCLDVLVDEDVLREFDVGDDPLEPMRAILGLPFASIWVFRRPGERRTRPDGSTS
jgi:ubiquinone/menaquinone biosynthesis C-methylase UbiE